MSLTNRPWRFGGVAVVTRESLGLLQQVRHMADVRLTATEQTRNFKGADTALARFCFVMEIAGAPIGPIQQAASVMITKAEYLSLRHVCAEAYVGTLPRGAFDHVLLHRTMRGLGHVVGEGTDAEWPLARGLIL